MVSKLSSSSLLILAGDGCFFLRMGVGLLLLLGELFSLFVNLFLSDGGVGILATEEKEEEGIWWLGGRMGVDGSKISTPPITMLSSSLLLMVLDED